MAFNKIFTGAISGINAKIVDVEVNLDKRGFPGFTIVGLPGKEVDEARERVKSAIKNSGYSFPDSKIIVNLAPADLHKRGSLYDLPIALGILSVSGVLKEADFSSYYVVGELSLNGEINKVGGVVPLVLDVLDRFKRIVVPADNFLEVEYIDTNKVFGFSNLKDVIEFINTKKYTPVKRNYKNQKLDLKENLFASIVGQDFAKRAIQIAVAGGHNIALFGPPGTGKSMLAKSVVELMPPLKIEEKLEISKIYSVSQLEFLDGEFNIRRPFRNPHHSITRSGLLGGGNPITPGEISLAHNGVLFLDEFSEFPRSVVESLRGPLEDQFIVISRFGERVKFPCKFMLVIAFNPCPCGNFGNPQKQCICSEHLIKRYRSKLSGPFLDRIDLFVNCRPFDLSLLSKASLKISKKEIISYKEAINNAYFIQQKRYKIHPNINLNRDLRADGFSDLLFISDDAEGSLNMYAQKFNISARAYHRIAKVARTIADLEASVYVEKKHILEALQYRVDF